MGIDDMPALVTPRELSELTGQHVGSITRGIREGRIPADRMGGRWLIPLDDVLPNACAAARRHAPAEGRARRGGGRDGR